MKVEGRCHCGRITYEAIVDPAKVSICHCTDCQMLTGSAYRASVPAPRDTFVLRSGQPKVYVKTADSGTRRAHAFCPDCGTPVYSSAISDPPSLLAARRLPGPAGGPPAEEADLVQVRGAVVHEPRGRRADRRAVSAGQPRK